MIAEINTIILGLTPIEKWKAAKHYDKGYISEYWFVITCAAVLIVLSVLLYSIIKISRKTKEATRIRPLFSEYAQKKGLSKREYEILLDIVARAKLKEKESIFTMPEAFNIDRKS